MRWCVVCGRPSALLPRRTVRVLARASLGETLCKQCGGRDRLVLALLRWINNWPDPDWYREHYKTRQGFFRALKAACL